jgi:hypothetical protein
MHCGVPLPSRMQAGCKVKRYKHAVHCETPPPHAIKFDTCMLRCTPTGLWAEPEQQLYPSSCQAALLLIFSSPAGKQFMCNAVSNTRLLSLFCFRTGHVQGKFHSFEQSQAF